MPRTRLQAVTVLGGALVFAAVALILHGFAGLPTWAAIMIPGFVVGVVEGVAGKCRRDR